MEMATVKLLELGSRLPQSATGSGCSSVLVTKLGWTDWLAATKRLDLPTIDSQECEMVA
jgi:hypothetical protein